MLATVLKTGDCDKSKQESKGWSGIAIAKGIACLCLCLCLCLWYDPQLYAYAGSDGGSASLIRTDRAFGSRKHIDALPAAQPVHQHGTSRALAQSITDDSPSASSILIELDDLNVRGARKHNHKKRRARPFPCPSEFQPPKKDDPRVVFSISTIPSRLPHLQSVLESVVEDQTRPPDAVYLSVGPEVKSLPSWLIEYNKTGCRPGVLHVLRMKVDYGPASKLLAAIHEGEERGKKNTLIIYGDDDITYGTDVVEQHLANQKKRRLSKEPPAAFGSRKISVDTVGRESLLEATGSISIFANDVPDDVFGIESKPDVCRLSDDYWISHFLTKNKVDLQVLPNCQYDFDKGQWWDGCGYSFTQVDFLSNIEPLSALPALDISAKNEHREKLAKSTGDWKTQLDRYSQCRTVLDKEALEEKKTKETKKMPTTPLAASPKRHRAKEASEGSRTPSDQPPVY